MLDLFYPYDNIGYYELYKLHNLWL